MVWQYLQLSHVSSPLQWRLGYATATKKTQKLKPKSWQRSRIQPWGEEAEKLSTFEAYPPNHCATSSCWYLGMLICCRVLASEIKAQSKPLRIGVLLFVQSDSSVLCSGSRHIACHQQQPCFWTRDCYPSRIHTFPRAQSGALTLIRFRRLLNNYKNLMQVDDKAGSESSFLHSLLQWSNITMKPFVFWYLIGKA